MSIGKLGPLIASLTKNEKTYFKRWLPNTTKENRYVQVFDLIDKHPGITINGLAGKLGLEYSNKQIKNINSHLWTSLLLSLRDYHRNNDIQLNFHARLDSIKVLRTKGQFSEALKATKKLVADCEEIEMFPEALRAIEHIENIRSVQKPLETEDPREWIELYEKKETICLSIAESCRVRILERELKSANDQVGVSITPNEYEDLLSKLKSRLEHLSVSEQSSVDARFRYYSINATISSVLKEKDNVARWFGQLEQLLDQNPVITDRYFKGFYIIVLHNYIQSLLGLENLDNIPLLLEKMNTRRAEIPELALRDFYLYGDNLLTYLNRIEAYELGLEAWETLNLQNKTSNDPNLEPLYTKFAIQGAIVCFWNSDFKRALSVLRSLFTQVKPTDGNADLILAKTLEIICNYEMGDDAHTEHLIAAQMRRAKSYSISNKSENLTIATIAKQLKTNVNNHQLWEKLHIDLLKLERGTSGQADQISFDFIKYANRNASTT